MNHPPIPDYIADFIQATQIPLTLTCPRISDDPVIKTNDAFLRMSEYTESEVVGHNCRFLQGAQTKSDARRRIRKALQSSGDFQIVLRNYRKSGTTFDNFLFIFPILGGDDQAVFNLGAQFEIPASGQTDALLRFADVLKDGLEGLNSERKSLRQSPIEYRQLTEMSPKSLVLTRIKSSV